MRKQRGLAFLIAFGLRVPMAPTVMPLAMSLITQCLNKRHLRRALHELCWRQAVQHGCEELYALSLDQHGDPIDSLIDCDLYTPEVQQEVNTIYKKYNRQDYGKEQRACRIAQDDMGDS